MIALEGTEDYAEEAQGTPNNQQGNLTPTIQPSAAEALKQQKKKQNGGGSSSLTTSSRQLPPKASMWRNAGEEGLAGQNALEHGAANTPSSLALKKGSQNGKVTLMGKEAASSRYSNGYNQR